MAILNYTTKVDAKKTVSEIQQMLAAAGAKRIMIDYDEKQNPEAVSFALLWNERMSFFRLPVEMGAVLRAMQKDTSIRKGFCIEEQAYRVAWRIIKDWTEAQLAIIEADQAKVQQVFLGYAMNENGVTLYEALDKGQNVKLITA